MMQLKEYEIRIADTDGIHPSLRGLNYRVRAYGERQALAGCIGEIGKSVNLGDKSKLFRSLWDRYEHNDGVEIAYLGEV